MNLNEGFKNKRLINYNDLVIGLHVHDNDGNIGIVKECSDIHNVFVEFIGGGSGYYCIVKGCTKIKNINGQIIKMPQYDPLYYYD